MAFKPIDPKRDEYRRYLERGGIIESLTKIFVRILKERPEDPTQYLLQNLGDARLQADNIAYLQSELDDARNEVARLTEIIRSINPDLLEQTSNKSINNDTNEIAGDKEHINMVQNSVEQNQVASVEENLQNSDLSEINVQSTAENNAVQLDAVANTE